MCVDLEALWEYN